MEIITGKRQVASPSFDKTFLFGKCACAANKGNSAIKKAIKFNSCPPSLEEVTAKFREEGIEGNAEAYLAFRHFLLNRYKVEDGFDLAFFKEQEL